MSDIRMIPKLLIIVFSTVIWATHAYAEPNANDGVQEALSAAEVASRVEETPEEVPKLPKSVRVGVAGSVPFVVKTEGVANETTGLSVELWRLMASRLEIGTEIVVYPSVDELIMGLESGDVRVAVGPISITRGRAERVEFTQPYMQSGIGIVTTPTMGVWGALGQLFSKGFWIAVSVLLSVLFMVGTMLWLFERRRNDHFDDGFVPGVANGMWLAIVTMTTVGYGDIAPMTKGGRVVASVWMIIAMFTASSLTAGIATVLTMSQISTAAVETPNDFQGRKVGAVKGTENARFVQRYGGELVLYDSVKEALDAANRREVSAVAHDRPILAHHLQAISDGELLLAEGIWDSQGYGFAFQLDDTLRRDIELSLLGLKERRELEPLIGDWL
ncbi:transporter substrate-binding domain-containing protein [Microvenator marinus]|uniref:Transporter substrate-binding domain-containing protein n=2 Tax=Microvenator marinus TaxID=2600177 RepID=A0A5B8XLV5_9DELT|nr:transporter substrate-binding domain-containing protein [Microvenator marinus]